MFLETLSFNVYFSLKCAYNELYWIIFVTLGSCLVYTVQAWPSQNGQHNRNSIKGLRRGM